MRPPPATVRHSNIHMALKKYNVSTNKGAARATAARIALGLILPSAVMLAACGAGSRAGAPLDSRSQTLPEPVPEAGGTGEYVTDDGVLVRPLGADEPTATRLPSAAPAAGGNQLAALTPDRTATATPRDGAPGSESRNPAVLALLANAERAASSGDQNRAAAGVERALKVEPRNPWLWHRLAQARLAQRQPQQAENLAARSSALAPGDRTLQTSNWHLIAQARDALGDRAGADQALAQAARYR
ncbi:MAG: tetratricopeptide repeat protein [Gammaproteobacteria bacterium]